MDMWQASFLELNDIYICQNSPENFPLVNIINKFLQLEFEYTGYKVRTIIRCLPR